jgi:deoxyguanosine kinase
MNNYSFIAIEGNIGAGKTTLANQLAQDFNARLILEQFDDNPFLSLFYEQPERYAFTVELFFMTERHRQLSENLAQTDMFQPLRIADYFFLKTSIFAKNNLNAEEYRLFQRLFLVLNSTFPKPNLLLYLHRSVPNLLKNIQKRNRSYEVDISPDYLLQIQNAYFDYFKTENQVPIVVLDVSDKDYVTNVENYEKIKSILQQRFEKGVHYLTL